MEKSDWSLTSWVTIMSLCRAFAVEETRRQKEMKKIKDYVDSAKKVVNLDEVIQAMTNLKQEPSEEVVLLMNEYKELLTAFTNKIKTINKNGKFVTENEG
jgi:DNA gyrase/topoisomerase IV subunit B